MDHVPAIEKEIGPCPWIEHKASGAERPETSLSSGHLGRTKNLGLPFAEANLTAGTLQISGRKEAEKKSTVFENTHI